MSEHRFHCRRCPFATSDVTARVGHERHGPEHGWLGQDETHVMTDGWKDGRQCSIERESGRCLTHQTDAKRDDAFGHYLATRPSHSPQGIATND